MYKKTVIHLYVQYYTGNRRKVKGDLDHFISKCEHLKIAPMICAELLTTLIDG